MTSTARRIELASEPRPEPALAVCPSNGVQSLFDAPSIRLPGLYEQTPGKTRGARKMRAIREARKLRRVRRGNVAASHFNHELNCFEIEPWADWFGKPAGELAGLDRPGEIPTPANKPNGWDQADDEDKRRDRMTEKGKRWWRGLQVEFPRKTDQQRHEIFVYRHGADLIAAGVRQFSLPTIRRWYTRKGMHSDGRRQRGGPAAHAAWAEEFKSYALSVFLNVFRGERGTLNAAFRIAVGRALEHGWANPGIDGYSTFRSWVNRIAPQPVRDFHYNKRQWERTRTESVRRDKGQFRPGEWWCGDWHRCDFLVLHRGRPVRPWLCIWWDMATGVVVSWCLVLRPNADELIYCYAEGVIAWGAPLNLLTDNGWDFVSQQFTGGKRYPFSEESQQKLRSVCDETGTVAHFAWPYNPGSKPPESWFRVFALNVSKLFHARGMYVGPHPEGRPPDLYRKLKSEGVEPGTLEEACEIVGRFVEKVWNEASNADPAQRPRRVAFAQDNPIPKRTLAEHEVRYKLMPRARVKVGRGGTVMLDGIKYGRGTVKSSTVLFDRQGQDVEIRWDRDRSRVFVHELNGKFLCEARDDRLYGVSDKDIKELHREKKAARKRCREVLPAKKFADADLTVQAMVEAQERFVAEQNNSRKAVGAESMRPLQLLPGAGELIDCLPMPRSGGLGGKDAVHPLDAAPLPAGREIRFINPIDEVPDLDVPGPDGADVGEDNVAPCRTEPTGVVDNVLDLLPDIPVMGRDDECDRAG